MNEPLEWMRALFEALTSKRLSRNKYFASFGGGWSKSVHRRYQIVRALGGQAERLAGVPESYCRVHWAAGRFRLCLHSPRLSYRREVVLFPYEWEWLGRQAGIQRLLSATGDGPVGAALPQGFAGAALATSKES
jgi:hypothetical protein